MMSVVLKPEHLAVKQVKLHLIIIQVGSVFSYMRGFELRQPHYYGKSITQFRPGNFSKSPRGQF